MKTTFRTYNLAVQLYRECTQLKMDRHLKDQLLRASSSVVLNLSEGTGLGSVQNQKKFFHIALGSLREVQACLDLANAPRSIVKLADRAGANLYGFIRSLG